MEAEHLGVARVGKIDNVLGDGQFRVARQHGLLPRHLVEVVVDQHQHDARDSMSFHHARTLSSMFARQPRSCFCASSGSRRRSVADQIDLSGITQAHAGCRQAHANLAGELGMCHGHEGRHFLVAYPNVVEAVFGPAQCTHDAVDAIAGITEYANDTPVAQALQQEVSSGLAHGDCSC